MKILILALISCFVGLNANDVQRVDDMVHDIQILKKNSQQDVESKNASEQQLKEKITLLESKIKQQSLELQKKPKVQIKTVIVTKTKDDNPFPKLQMKPKFFKAGTFRVNKDADIYDSKDGKVIDRWEKGTSFTSSKRTDDMIKITGYFVDKIWRKSEKTMWIQSENAFER